jgi:hypothetical protein
MVLLGGVAARASGPLGVVAVIDKVVYEPDGDSPTRVQVWGTFVLAQGRGPLVYGKPEYGSMYYEAGPDMQEQCRSAWADLKKRAGTGVPVGWGDIDGGQKFGRVRRPGEPTADPDPYPVGFGVQELRRDSNFPAVKTLMNIAAPLSPIGDMGVVPGKVELVARNARAAGGGVHYLFEIESAAGEKETSPALEAGKEQTSWKPHMAVKPGEKYTWRVWTNAEKKPAHESSTATFKGRQAP